jgi:hypothetical protein
MNATKTPAPEDQGSAGDEPIFLVGDSKSLRGSIQLTNPGKERILVREANLRLKLPQTRKPVPIGQASLSVSLQPGEAQRAKINLDMDPNTPPGQYQGEMDVNGETRPVTVYIPEVVRLTITPQTLVIDKGSGATVVKQVVFSNEGNIPLTIGPIGLIQLGKEFMLRRGFHITLAAAGEKNSPPIEKLFTEFVGEDSREVFGDAGFLEVRKPAASVLLQPGDVKLIDLEIHLPDKLEPNNRYIGRVPLYTSDLEFIVVPAAGEQPGSRIQ